MFLYPIYSTNDVSTALLLCTTETELWDCDFCPASCLDVPKEAKKYRAEFLGTHFAFGLGQGSELCASIGCRRKRVAQSFVSELQSRTG